MVGPSGPISKRRDLGNMRDYLVAVCEAVRPYVEAGAPLERALADIRLDQYASWVHPDRLAQAIERAYAELA